MFGTVGERMVSEKKKDVAKPWILFALIGLLILFRFLLAAGLGNTINSEAGSVN